VVTACIKGILMLRKSTKTLSTDDQSVGQSCWLCLSPTQPRKMWNSKRVPAN